MIVFNPPPIYQNPDDILDITAGDYHTCARKRNGNVYCWGVEGGPTDSVPHLIWTGAKQIDAGFSHTCGLNSSGAAFCWGGGNQGQLGLGNGQFTTYNTPWQVAGPGWNGTPLTYTSIGAGGYSTCGTTSTGVFCWGLLGNTLNPSQGVASPTLVTNAGGTSYNGFTSLAVGYDHACGYINWAEVANCWGGDNFGQVGVDKATAIFYPGTSIVMFTMPNQLGNAVARVSAGYDYTCADMTGGGVECFGLNLYGVLGNGTAGLGTETFIPQTVSGSQQFHGVSTGTYHACALNQTGAAFCWGYGVSGELGNGMAMSSSTPQTVTGGRTYRAIAAGKYHTCAIGTDNHIYCWGQNNTRQLGTWIFDANGNVLTNGFTPNPVQAQDPK
jgi:alpha-tubulin suppressor-like RCC1 family protein